MGSPSSIRSLKYDSGSFRDRDGRVFFDEQGAVYRAVSAHALAEWRFISQTRFYQQACDQGHIVFTELVMSTGVSESSGRSARLAGHPVSRLEEENNGQRCDPDQSESCANNRSLSSDPICPLADTECLRGCPPGPRPDGKWGMGNQSEDWAGILRHAAIPCISYPFEWSFGMLQDAALLHLELLDTALNEDVTLKDGTAYNLQWCGIQPVFIDIPSMERLVPGTPWNGYRQFCQTFLYPLMLQAYKRIPFQPWLRGQLEGIPPRQFRNLMSWRDLFRPGVLKHVWLHALLDSAQRTDYAETGRGLSAAGFEKSLIQNNLRGLKKLVRRLHIKGTESNWLNYTTDNQYSAADRDLKEDFVRRSLASHPRQLTWDLGCNTGQYSRIAAHFSDTVLAMDADVMVIERLYQSLKSAPEVSSSKILPLVMNLADLQGGLGWRSEERKSLVKRGQPQMTLCLALLHHLVITHGIPLADLIEWFAELQTDLIIEFVDRSDPMVQRLLRGRTHSYPEYDRQVFEQLLADRYVVRDSLPLTSVARTLYFAQRRDQT